MKYQDEWFFGALLITVFIGLIIMGFVASGCHSTAHAYGVKQSSQVLSQEILDHFTETNDEIVEESKIDHMLLLRKLDLLVEVADLHGGTFKLMIKDAMGKTDQIYQLRLENNEMRKEMAKIKHFIDYQEVNSE
jgi:hypothetical protein